MEHFGKTFAALRAASGFSTAYAFYHRNGGRRVFPFTFAFYNKIERGLSLPRGAWLGLLLSMLRIPAGAADRRRLIIAYFKDCFADDDAFEALAVPWLQAAPAPATRRHAIRRLVGDQAYHVTPAQFKAILSSRAAYWCFNCLIHSHKPLSPEELGAAARLETLAARAALARLAKARVARATGKGRYLSPLARRYCVYPRGYPGYGRDIQRLRSYIAAAYRSSGRELMDKGILLRAERASIDEVMRSFEETLEAASASSVYDSSEETAFFTLETRIRRILPF